jgi:hypothetical protein
MQSPVNEEHGKWVLRCYEDGIGYMLKGIAVMGFAVETGLIGDPWEIDRLRDLASQLDTICRIAEDNDVARRASIEKGIQESRDKRSGGR